MIPVLIIPILNRYDLLDQAIDSINYPIQEILIINNGEENYQPKREDLNIRVLNLPSNLGVSGSWNLGIKLYPYVPYWMFSSADTKFVEETFPKFQELSGPDKMIKSTAAYNCFTLGENIVKRVGLFDEYIYPAYFEDNDYDERMQIEGIHHEGNVSGDIVPVHSMAGSATIGSDSHYQHRNNYTYVTNQNYLQQKRINYDYTCKGWDLERRRQNEWRRM